MGSLKRKMQRNKMKKFKKDFKKRLKQQMMMFDKLEDECAACEKPFDKKSKEHASTWKVVVREEEQVVRLYCPDCWGKANKVIKEIENDLRVHEESRCENTGESQSK